MGGGAAAVHCVGDLLSIEGALKGGACMTADPAGLGALLGSSSFSTSDFVPLAPAPRLPAWPLRSFFSFGGFGVPVDCGGMDDGGGGGGGYGCG